MAMNILSRFFPSGSKQGSNRDGEEELKKTNPIRWFLERGIKKALSRECYIYLIFPDGSVYQEYCNTHGDRIRDAIKNKFGNVDDLILSNDIGEAAAKDYGTMCLRLCSPLIGSCAFNYPDEPTREQLEGLKMFKTLFDDYTINNPDYPTQIIFKHPETLDEESDLNVFLDYYEKKYDSSSGKNLH